MKLVTRLWLLITLCFAIARVIQPESAITLAQANDCSTCCDSYAQTSEPCPGENCSGNIPVTAGYRTGDGLKSWKLQSVPCDNPNCAGGSVNTAVDNPYCCDRDHDTYNRPGCGAGSDCDDDPNTGYGVHPGAAEICGNGKDDDCQGGDAPCSCEENCDYGECPDTCWGPADPCAYPNNDGCPNTWTRSGHCCFKPSPILIDVTGNGFQLTDVARGVQFDINGDGTQEHIAWTATTGTNAWLALDRNGNGMIDNGAELFGNFTPQPTPPVGRIRNGFNALAEYDKSANGGNGDGVIDRRDSIFNHLRLWQDANHNGVSESAELHSLDELDVISLSLDYKESKRLDQYGNGFRYRAKIDDAKHSNAGRWAWDVFLVVQ